MKITSLSRDLCITFKQTNRFSLFFVYNDSTYFRNSLIFGLNKHPKTILYLIIPPNQQIPRKQTFWSNLIQQKYPRQPKTHRIFKIRLDINHFKKQNISAQKPRCSHNWDVFLPKTPHGHQQSRLTSQASQREQSSYQLLSASDSELDGKASSTSNSANPQQFIKVYRNMHDKYLKKFSNLDETCLCVLHELNWGEEERYTLGLITGCTHASNTGPWINPQFPNQNGTSDSP